MICTPSDDLLFEIILCPLAWIIKRPHLFHGTLSFLQHQSHMITPHGVKVASNQPNQ